MNIQLQQQITSGIEFVMFTTTIPVFTFTPRRRHRQNRLARAHLFSWQPAHSKQDVLWLSDIEPFKAGTAIRGGIPICYPWFNNAGTPAHGFARTSLWQLSDYEIGSDKVRLVFFVVFKTQHHLG